MVLAISALQQNVGIAQTVMEREKPMSEVFADAYRILGQTIDIQYKGAKRKFAHKCVEYAQEWLAVEIAPLEAQPRVIFGINNDGLTSVDRKHLYKSCRKYVAECAKTSEERKIWGSMLFLMIFGAIMSWIVKRLLDIWFPPQGE